MTDPAPSDAGGDWIARSPAIGLAVLLTTWGIVPTMLGAIVGPPSGARAVILQFGVVPVIVIGVATAFSIAFDGAELRLLARAWRAIEAFPSRWFDVMVAALTFAFAAGASWYLYRGHPTVGDEMTQQLQARMLLAGRLWLRPESHLEFFTSPQTMVVGDRWFGEFPAGGPLLLAIPLAAGMPWVLNPVMAAWTTVLAHRFVARVGGESIGRGTALLFATSPFVTFQSATWMNHASTLAFAMLAFLAATRWYDAGQAGARARHAVVMGFALGMVALIRPYEGAFLAVVIGAYQLPAIVADRRRVGSVALELVALAVPVGVLLAINAATTGHPFLFGYDALNGPAHRPGFHTDPSGRPFTVPQGMYWTALYLDALETDLLQWPLPALALVIGGLLTWPVVGRHAALAMASILAPMLAYTAYWHYGPINGPRFLYLAVPALLMFVAGLIRRIAMSSTMPRLRNGLLLAVPACAVLAWLPRRIPLIITGAPGRAAFYRAAAGPNRVDIDGAVEHAGLTNALVFVTESVHARMAAELRALGMAPFPAERAAADLDACALMTALDATADSLRPSPERLRRVLDQAKAAGAAIPMPGLFGNDALALADGRPRDRGCADAIRRGFGALPLTAFLPYNGIDSAGRFGGRVVFVRDLGAANEHLRDRFGSRTWYRYRRVGNAMPTFEPYERAGR